MESPVVKGMRATSACCLLSARRLIARPQMSAQRGLTLLELLIVLLLIGLLTALVAPRAGAQLEAARHRALQRQLRAVVEELPLRAFESGHELRVSSADLQAMLGEDWPAEYRVAIGKELRYGPTGLASGGEVRVLRSDQGWMSWYVEPFTGRLSAMPGTTSIPR